MRVVVVLASLFIACGGKSKPTSGGGGAEVARPMLDKAKAKAIADTLTLGDGWTKGLANAQGDGFMLSFASAPNARGGKVNLVVVGLNCLGEMCAELRVDAWKKNEDNLESKLSKTHRDNPQLVWELGQTELDGKPAIASYALSYVDKASDAGTTRLALHTYDLYWHDGGRLINVTASADAGAQSLDELKTKVTRAELEAAAKKAMSLVIAKL